MGVISISHDCIEINNDKDIPRKEIQSLIISHNHILALLWKMWQQVRRIEHAMKMLDNREGYIAVTVILFNTIYNSYNDRIQCAYLYTKIAETQKYPCYKVKMSSQGKIYEFSYQFTFQQSFYLFVKSLSYFTFSTSLLLLKPLLFLQPLKYLTFFLRRPLLFITFCMQFNSCHFISSLFYSKPFGTTAQILASAKSLDVYQMLYHFYEYCKETK